MACKFKCYMTTGEFLNRPSAVAAAPKVAKAGTSIGHTIKLKADIAGDEDLRIDGELEGRIELPKSNVFIGPSGKVRFSPPTVGTGSAFGSKP